MKAMVCPEYGPPEVLEFREVEKPAPRKDEVLIRVCAATVTVEEPKIRSGRFGYPFWMECLARLVVGWRRPKQPILGFEVSGVVEALGPECRGLEIGDPVYGDTGLGFGAYAEYVCVSQRRGALARKPGNISFAEAATLPNGALTSLVYLHKKAKIARGEQVLINGASGSVGAAAVQLAKHFGAEVTGVSSAKNLERVRELGADYLLDYQREDFTQQGRRYDIIFDVASTSSWARCRGCLHAGGRYLRTEFGLSDVLRASLSAWFSDKKTIVAASNFHWEAADLDFLRGLVEAGALKPVVDRSFALRDAAEAHRYVEQGKRGNVVLLVDGKAHES